MKLVQNLAILSCLLVSGSAFAPGRSSTIKKTALDASKNDFWLPAASSVVGWALLSQTAFANPNVLDRDIQFPSNTIAYEKLDFSMPSYEASSTSSSKVGFGDGAEAYLEEDRDTEVDLQAQAMKKAEEARKARVAEKKKALKMREEEQKRREEEKKAENARRLKGIFD